MRKVYRKGNKIISESVIDSDNTKKKGGKLTRTTIFEMDETEARRQLNWIEEELKKAKEEYKRHKHNLTPAGRQNLIYLEKQQLSESHKRYMELKELKEGYEKVLE